MTPKLSHPHSRFRHVTDFFQADEVSPEETYRLALRGIERAVREIARDLGSPMVQHPMFPDRPELGPGLTDIEPVLGLRLTFELSRAARVRSTHYVRSAREDGHSWEHIGAALGLTDQAADCGLSNAAYDYATASDHAYGTRSFAWVCPACKDTVLDRGPEAGHPTDCEPGHADDCPRLAADVAKYDASWEEE